MPMNKKFARRGPDVQVDNTETIYDRPTVTAKKVHFILFARDQ